MIWQLSLRYLIVGSLLLPPNHEESGLSYIVSLFVHYAVDAIEITSEIVNYLIKMPEDE